MRYRVDVIGYDDSYTKYFETEEEAYNYASEEIAKGVHSAQVEPIRETEDD